MCCLIPCVFRDDDGWTLGKEENTGEEKGANFYSVKTVTKINSKIHDEQRHQHQVFHTSCSHSAQLVLIDHRML